MARRVLGPTGGRRRRRLGLAAAAAVTVCLTVFVASASGNLAGSPFDGGDGNLVLNDEAQDWANAPSLRVGIDKPTGQTDDSFGNGTKEDTAVPSVIDGSIPNNKSDLTRFYVGNDKVAGKDFLYLAWERVQEPSGTTNMDFEFNQSSQVSSNGVTPVRTAGDLLIKYDLSQGGTNPNLGIHRWVTSGNAAQVCEASNTVPCWGKVAPLAGHFEGSINTAPVVDPIAPNAPRTLSARTFGEAAINLTDSGLFPAGDCRVFNGAYLKSRSSDSFTAAVKDFIAPIATQVSNCGGIRIDKVTIPANDPQSFGFTLTGGPSNLNQSFNLTDAAAPHSSGDALAGSGYAAAEQTPAGWDLTSATCSDSSPVGNISLSVGETVTCTFTNTKRGEIIIDKVTNPAGDAQSFDFTLTGGPSALSDSFSLTDAAAPRSSGKIKPGSGYNAAETVPAGWDLSSATCSDGSPVTNIDVSPGEVITCTFTNTKRGEIVIDKVTLPAGQSQSFDFSLTGGPSALSQTFSLTDAATPHNSGKIKPGSGYNASETVPAGWDQTSATCSDGSPVGNINVGAGEIVTCTFTNTKRGHILVDKVTNPAGDPASFTFTLSGGSIAIPQVFGLTDASDPRDSGALAPGSGYSVTEAPLAGWDLTAFSCSDGSPVTNIDLGPGETVTCTFTNTKRGHIVIDKVTSPAGDPQLFDFALTGGPDAINDTFQLADATQAHDSGAVKPGEYAAAETVPTGWNQTGAVCSDGSDVDAISVGPGETVTCTFTNTKRGTIIVEKQTNPDNAAGSFTFSGDASGSIGDGGQIVVNDLAPGTYTSTEADPTPGFDLTEIDCDDADSTGDLDTRTATFHLQAGETVKCTFTNRQRAKITVLKKDDASPANTLEGAEFQLKDGSDVLDTCTTGADGKCSFVNVVPGTYTLHESKAPDAHHALAPDQQVTVGAGGEETVTFVDPRLHKVIVLVCHEGTNTLAGSDVTGDVAGTTLESGATLPDGVSEADLCSLGGATQDGLGHGEIDATVDVGSDSHTP